MPAESERLTDGAGVMVLESASHAEDRGHAPLAEVCAFAESFDCHNLIAIEPEGRQIENMLRNALDASGCNAKDITYVNAHGTSTTLNDEVELDVLQRMGFDNALVNSTKGLIGHTIGASGAIEAVVTALSLRDGVVHPCINLDTPINSLSFPSNKSIKEYGPAISQSFAFGGHNCCLVLSEPRIH